MPPLAELLGRTAERFGIQDIYVFGSRAHEIAIRVKGQPTEEPLSNADVDVGVQLLPGRRLDSQARVRLAVELEDLFDAPRADLVILGEANAFLAAEVVSGELLFSLDPHAQAEQELYVLRRAGDLAFFRRERTRAVLTSDAR